MFLYDVLFFIAASIVCNRCCQDIINMLCIPKEFVSSLACCSMGGVYMKGRRSGDRREKSGGRTQVFTNLRRKSEPVQR